MNTSLTGRIEVRRATPSKALPSCLSSGLGPTYKRLRRPCGGSPPSSPAPPPPGIAAAASRSLNE